MPSPLLILKLPLLPRATGMDTMNQNMKTRHPHSNHTEVSQQPTHKALPIKDMARNPTVSHHRDLKFNLMGSPGLINLEICRIRALFHLPSRTVQMPLLNSPILMHLVGPCSKVILHMVLHLLLMVIATLHLPQHRPLFILSKPASLLLDMVSLVASRLLVMLQVRPAITVRTQLHSQVILNKQPQTIQDMGIKGQQIQLTAVPQRLMVHHCLRGSSQFILNRLQPILDMINLSHKQLVMEVYLLVTKVCLRSLVILIMTRIRCMLGSVEDFDNVPVTISSF